MTAYGEHHYLLNDVGVDFPRRKGSSRKLYSLIVADIAALILSTLVIGYSTYLKGGVISH